MSPGPVFLKRHVRNSKYEPLVDEVDLLEANPDYAHVRFPNGRETTVSIRHLAPVGSEVLTEDNQNLLEHSMSSGSPMLMLQNDAVTAESTSADILESRLRYH